MLPIILGVDVAKLYTFFKPGPAMGGMAQHFVRRYRGEEAVSFLHPALKPILGSSQGVLLFQEQVLQVARDIAGLSWEQANQLRQGISKFKHEAVAQLRQQFVAGCQRPAPAGPGFDLKQAETLWGQVEVFAGYGFNQGHATAYADISYRLAYLKAHWPAELLCARLVTRGGFHSQAIYIAEARRLGISVRPPHLNHSGASFSLSDEDVAAGTSQKRGVLRMGLGQVRDLRRSTVQAIISARKQRPFSGLPDLLAAVKLRTKELVHLIQCGALDGLGESRAALLAEVDRSDKAGSAMQMALPFAKPAVSPESPAQRLAWEIAVLGLPISLHPLRVVADRLPEAVSLAQLPHHPDKPLTVAGVRIPAWTGGRGFYLGDGQTYVVAKPARSLETPPPWEPLMLRGRWLNDEYGTAWLQVESIRSVQRAS